MAGIETTFLMQEIEKALNKEKSMRLKNHLREALSHLKEYDQLKKDTDFKKIK